MIAREPAELFRKQWVEVHGKETRPGRSGRRGSRGEVSGTVMKNQQLSSKHLFTLTGRISFCIAKAIASSACSQ